MLRYLSILSILALTNSCINAEQSHFNIVKIGTSRSLSKISLSIIVEVDGDIINNYEMMIYNGNKLHSDSLPYNDDIRVLTVDCCSVRIVVFHEKGSGDIEIKNLKSGGIYSIKVILRSSPNVISINTRTSQKGKNI